MRTRWMVIVGATSLSLMACSNKAAQLRTQAAGELGCAETTLSLHGIAGYVEKVEGCGKENVYSYDFAQGKWISAMDRAAFDFSCKSSEMTVQHINALQVGVSGCNHKAVYVLTPTGWVMNTERDTRPKRSREQVAGYDIQFDNPFAYVGAKDRDLTRSPRRTSRSSPSSTTGTTRRSRTRASSSRSA